MSKFEEMAIVIISYDGYSDLWDDFFNLFNKNWKDNKYNLYLVNNIKKVSYEGVKIINTDIEDQWSIRTKKALESIKEKYILLLVEDYFIADKVNSEQIEEILKFVIENDVLYYKFKMANFSKAIINKIKNNNNLYEIPENLEYGISLQPAIWEKNYLLNLIGTENYNAWKFELDRISDMKIGSSKSIERHYFDNRNVLNICHMVVQGQLLPNALKTLKKKKYKLKSVRKRMEWKTYCFYVLKGKIKHIISKELREKLKNIMEKFGIEFVSRKN